MNELEKVTASSNARYQKLRMKPFSCWMQRQGRTLSIRPKSLWKPPSHRCCADQARRSAKGGVVIAIKEELGLPVKWIGVGEGIMDFRPFEADKFVDALFDGDK